MNLSLKKIRQKILEINFKKFLLLSFISLIFIFLLLFLFKSKIILLTFDFFSKKVEMKHNIKINIDKIKIKNILDIDINNLTVEKNNHKFIDINNLTIQPNLLSIFFFNLKLNSLKIENCNIDISSISQNKSHNTKFDTNTYPKNSHNYYNFSKNIYNKLIKLTPKYLDINNLYYTDIIDNDTLKISINNLTLNNNELSGYVVSNYKNEQLYNIEGNIYPKFENCVIKINTNDNTDFINIPYIKEKLKMDIGFKNLTFSIEKINNFYNSLNIRGKIISENLIFNHPKIASNKVIIDKYEFCYNFNIYNDYLEFNNDTNINVNSTKYYLYSKYKYTEDKSFDLKINTDKMPIDTFINNLPTTMFPHITQMKINGNIKYHLNFHIDFKNPYDLTFDSKLEKENLSIISTGDINLNQLNESFLYTPYEKNFPMKSFYVGPESNNYVKLENISDYLKKAVLTSEDPSFFSHKGFILEAFRQSIAKNFSTKHFARGGSTISMQLVKNVFLTPEKTISRKLEEIFIVWLIENCNICSKEKMFEIYLNIIEWGPRIYGIKEAAQFYFNKTPDQLNLNESIFLASIIPSPKKFKKFVDSDGKVNNIFNEHKNFLISHMLKKNLLSAEDTIGSKLTVELQGKAKRYITEPEIVDSLDNEEEDFF